MQSNNISVQKDRYVSISDFARLVGVKQNYTSSTTFKNTLKELHNKSILKLYYQNNNTYLFKEEIEKYFSEHLSYNEIINYAELSRQTMGELIKKYNFNSHKFGRNYDQIFLSKDLVNKYIINDEFICGYELIKTLGIDKENSKRFPRRAVRSVIQNIKKDKQLCKLIGYKRLEYPLYFKGQSRYPQHDVFNKKLVFSFIDSHISTRKVLDNFKLKRSNLLNMLSGHEMPLYSFYNNHRFKFISKTDYEILNIHLKLKEKGASQVYLKNKKYLKLKLEDNHYTKGEVQTFLKTTHENIDAILSEYEIFPDKEVHFNFNQMTTYFYAKADIHFLIEEQQKLLKYYNENYYTHQQIKEIPEIKNSYGLIYQTAKRGEIEATECPLLLRGILRLTSGKSLFNKSHVDEFLSRYNQNKQMASVQINSHYSEFIYKTEEIMNAKFPEHLKMTKTLWYQHVKQKLKVKSLKNTTGYINQLSRTSFLLSNELSKEIYNYSANSLNLKFFNEKVHIPHSYKCIIYDFCISVAEAFEKQSGKSYFRLERINNPYNFSKKRSVDMSRYTFVEYKALFDYSIDITIHKHKAIQDLEAFINGKNTYLYDNYWVYILTHLNNNWRHSTIVSEIPQVDLSNTKIKSLDWLKKNNPSISDANSIIFQIGRTVKKISKTGAETEFRISEPLKIPFAIAVSICQFRQNYILEKNHFTDNMTGQLLLISETNVILSHHSIHKQFFNGFTPNFKFSNRKMNKTLTTLIWSVFRSLKVAQASRSHFSEDSTMSYIELSDDQLEYLVNQLFETNSFGYIYQLLIEKLFDSNGNDRGVGTEKLSALQTKFGDVQKVEVSTGLLNSIAKQNEDILKFVNELSKDEVKDLITHSMTNTLYSKQRYYQCVFAKCIFNIQSTNVQDCSACPYSVINVYALSNLMNLYLKQINNLINHFDSANDGEKQKLANHFFLLWRQIQAAKVKFGDVIYDFVEGGKERFMELSKQLPKTKKYLSKGLESVK